MLEQAAGVTIYKTRKKEARQKLDATESDLARIEDLEQQLKVTKQRASQSNREHLKLMHDHNVAQGQICHLQEDLALAKRRLAFVESKLPRFLRYFLGV